MIRRPPRSTLFPLHDALPISDAGDGHQALERHARIHVLQVVQMGAAHGDRKSTRLNSSHTVISYAVFCLKKNTSADNQSASSVQQFTERRQRRSSSDAT